MYAGGSQEARKVLGFLFESSRSESSCCAYAKGFRATGPIGIVEPTLDIGMHFFLV